jgi:hypothetical protein
MGLIYYNNWITAVRDTNGWGIFPAKPVQGSEWHHDSFDMIKHYGLSTDQIVQCLFCLNAGRLGYYIFNLKNKEAHYCGLLMADVATKLQELRAGILLPD